MRMFTGCKLRSGKGSLKGGGFRVKTALNRKSNRNESQTVVPRMQRQGGSVVGGVRKSYATTIDHQKLQRDNSQSFSWVSKNNTGADGRRRTMNIQGGDQVQNHRNIYEPHAPNEMFGQISQNIAVTEYLSAGQTIDQQTSTRLVQNPNPGYLTVNSNFRGLNRPITTNTVQYDSQNFIQSRIQNYNQSTSNPSQYIVEASSQTQNEFARKGMGMLSPDLAQSEQAPSMQTGFKKSHDNENMGQLEDNKQRKSAEPTHRSFRKSFPGSELNDADDQSIPQLQDDLKVFEVANRRQSVKAQYESGPKSNFILEKNCSKSLVLKSALVDRDPKDGQTAKTLASQQDKMRIQSGYQPRGGRFMRNEGPGWQKSEMIPTKSHKLRTDNISQPLYQKENIESNSQNVFGQHASAKEIWRQPSYEQLQMPYKTQVTHEDANMAQVSNMQSKLKNQGIQADAYNDEQFDATKEAYGGEHQQTLEYLNNRRRSKSHQQSIIKANVDPDLIRFYEAFTNQKSSSKMPIKPAGVDFKKDLWRLKKVSQDVKDTMMKVQIEKINSLNLDSNIRGPLTEQKEESSTTNNNMVYSGSGSPNRLSRKQLSKITKPKYYQQTEDDKVMNTQQFSNCQSKSFISRNDSNFKSKLNSNTGKMQSRSLGESKQISPTAKRSINYQDLPLNGFELIQKRSNHSSKQRRDSLPQTGKLMNTISVHEITERKSLNDDIQNLIAQPSDAVPKQTLRETINQDKINHLSGSSSIKNDELSVNQQSNLQRTNSEQSPSKQQKPDELFDKLRINQDSASVKHINVVQNELIDGLVTKKQSAQELNPQELTVYDNRQRQEEGGMDDLPADQEQLQTFDKQDFLAGLTSNKLNIIEQPLGLPILIDENVPPPPQPEKEQPESYQIVEDNVTGQDYMSQPGAPRSSQLNGILNKNKMVDAQTGIIDYATIDQHNVSSLSNFQIGAALFQNDTLSGLDSQNPVASTLKKQNNFFDSHTRGSLKKIAVSGHTKGNWQNNYRMRRIATKQEFYRYPNPQNGLNSKISRKRLQTGHPSNAYKRRQYTKAQSIKEDQPLSSISLNMSNFNEDRYGKLEQKIQGVSNSRPLLQSMGQYQQLLQSRQKVSNFVTKTENITIHHDDQIHQLRQKMESDLYEAKNFEYTPKPGLSQISENDNVSVRMRSRGASPVLSTQSNKNSQQTQVKSLNTVHRTKSSTRPVSMYNRKTPIGVPKEAVIRVQGAIVKPGFQTDMNFSNYLSLDDGKEMGRNVSGESLKMAHLDIMNHNDIELALRFEQAQRSLGYQGPSNDEQKFKNFKGQVKQAIQQAESMRTLNDRPCPNLCPALYSRISCHSGKDHVKSLKSAQKRRQEDNERLSQARPMRQMMKVHLQYNDTAKKEILVDEPSFADTDHKMSRALHEVITKKQNRNHLSSKRLKSNASLHNQSRKSQDHLVGQYHFQVDKSVKDKMNAVSSLSIYKIGNNASVNASLQTYMNKTASLNQTIARPSQQSFKVSDARKSLTNKFSKPSVGSASHNPEGPISVVESRGGNEVHISAGNMKNFLKLDKRKKSRGASAKLRANKLTKGPKDMTASRSHFNNTIIQENSEKYLNMVGEESTPTIMRATIGELGSLNKLDPSIKSLQTLNSDLPDNEAKFAPKSVYQE